MQETLNCCALEGSLVPLVNVGTFEYCARNLFSRYLLLSVRRLGIYEDANKDLVLGACVASLKDKPESAFSNRVVQATRIAPSIWPIVFSGMLGNAVRAFADWRVERGVELLVRVVSGLLRRMC